MKSQGVRRAGAIILLWMVTVALSGCGKVELAPRYRDVAQATLIYEFRADGTWTATWENKVPMGVFVQGSARRVGGVYELRGRRLRLTCQSVSERDPVGGVFQPVRVFDGNDEALLRGYDHGFEMQEGKLQPSEPDHPFGGGELVPLEQPK